MAKSAMPNRRNKRTKRRASGGSASLDRARTLLREQARQLHEQCLDTQYELQRTRDRYRTLYDEAPLGFLTLDSKSIIREINQAAATLLSDRQSRLIGKPLIVLVDRRDGGLLLRHLSECARSGKAAVELRLRNGAIASMHTTKAWMPGSGVRAYHVVLTDTDAQQESQRMLRASEKRYREIVETAHEGICIVDDNNVITFSNSRFGSMVGANAKELVGLSAYQFLPAEQRRDASVAFARLKEGYAGKPEMRLKRLNGSCFWTSVSTSILRDESGAFAGAVLLFTDITDRKELDATRDRLVRQLVTAQELERQRIARELHDQMGQHLVGLSLGLNRLAQIGASLPEVGSITRRLQELTETISRDVRNLALELRPAALDDLGLSDAVSNYADGVAQRFGLEVDVHCDCASRLDAAAETTVYRIVQEALTNVVKHAAARRVSVILEEHGDVLHTIVEDDGVGFQPRRGLGTVLPDGRLGLAGMSERAALIGGDLQIESRPGRGTTVFLRVPLRPKEQRGHEEAASIAG